MVRSSDRPALSSPFVPSLIAAGGAALLVYQWQWGRMLWLDEEMIAINLRDRTFGQLAGRLSLGQAAPYGWLALQRVMLLTFGGSERALRAVPLLFGVALLMVAVWVGRRWMTATGAAALTFLCAAGQWVAFHALELKHYSADTCSSLLIPALAVWALEEDRLLAWWTVAAIAQWFSNGALFVVPVCMAMVFAARGWNRVNRIGSAIWLISFGFNFIINLGPVRANDFLNQYWSNAFPPGGSGFVATVEWLASRLAPFAIKPGGSGFGVWLWIVAATGFIGATRTSPLFRLTFGLIPISGLLFAAIRLVPLFERLALWMVPAAYVGVALGVELVGQRIDQFRLQRRLIGTQRSNAEFAEDAPLDRSARSAFSALSRFRRLWDLGAAIAGSLLFAALLANVAVRGSTYVALREPEANHDVDDRAAVAWLMRYRQPGSAWLTTRNAMPAIWWYANDDLPALEAVVNADPQACGPSELGETLRRDGVTRALVYLGFGHNTPPPLDDTLLIRLGALGRVSAYNRFGTSGHAVVVDLREPPSGRVTLAMLGALDEAERVDVSGCIAVSPAQRW